MVHPLQLAKVIAQVSIDKLRIAVRRLIVDFVLRINGSCILDLRLFSCPFGRGHDDNIDMARLAAISLILVVLLLMEFLDVSVLW